MKKGTFIDRGQNAEVFMWEDGQVCKLFYENAPLSWIKREAEVNRKLSSIGLPIPRFFGEIEVNGRHGLLYEYIKGPSMLSLITAKPWKIRKFARTMAELHTEVHTFRIPELPSLREFIVERIPLARFVSEKQKEQALHVLSQLPDENVLCHFEFHPRQILMSARKNMIIDWTLAYHGHPHADVARTLIILRTNPMPFQNRFQYLFVNKMRMTFSQIYLRHYLELHPEITHEQINAWMLPLAVQRLAHPEPDPNTSKTEKDREYAKLLNIVENLFSSYSKTAGSMPTPALSPD